VRGSILDPRRTFNMAQPRQHQDPEARIADLEQRLAHLERVVKSHEDALKLIRGAFREVKGRLPNRDPFGRL
jgi:hypothetical protein